MPVPKETDTVTAVPSDRDWCSDESWVGLVQSGGWLSSKGRTLRWVRKNTQEAARQRRGGKAFQAEGTAVRRRRGWDCPVPGVRKSGAQMDSQAAWA